MVLMVAISLRQLQKISPSGGGRRVSPLPPPQKIVGNIVSFWCEMSESYHVKALSVHIC
jgi:hypothetical protein